MAKITIKGSKELIAKLDRVGKNTTEVAKKVVYAGAGVVADAVRKNLKSNLTGSEYSTGDLLESLGITPIEVHPNGDVDAKIGFDGYDRKGVANRLKARAMESGTSTQKKRPFFRPAVRKTREQAQAKMEAVAEKELEKLMKG